MGIEVKAVPQLHPNLGRQKVHDSKSRSFPTKVVVDRSTWKTKTIRIYDPKFNPNQCHGECTGCAKAMEMNAAGNRVAGQVFTMDDAHKLYSLATKLDPFSGEWPPDDTGSSGLAASKAAQKLGIGGEYRHVFGGADEVVQLIMLGRVVNVGTWWYEGLFHPDAKGIVEPSGPQVGGHQFIVQGYYKPLDMVVIRCWWGDYRDVYLKREHLNQLLLDGGDAHIQDRIR